MKFNLVYSIIYLNQIKNIYFFFRENEKKIQTIIYLSIIIALEFKINLLFDFSNTTSFHFYNKINVFFNCIIQYYIFKQVLMDKVNVINSIVYCNCVKRFLLLTINRFVPVLTKCFYFLSVFDKIVWYYGLSILCIEVYDFGRFSVKVRVIYLYQSINFTYFMVREHIMR